MTETDRVLCDQIKADAAVILRSENKTIREAAMEILECVDIFQAAVSGLVEPKPPERTRKVCPF